MKYIIEIEDEPFGRDDDMEHYLYRAKGFKSLVFDQEGLAKLVEFDHMRPSWYEETYQKGLDDAWDAVKYYCDTAVSLRMGMFGCYTPKAFIEMYTPSEAIAKLKEYKQQYHVEIGDEIYLNDKGYTGVVTALDGEHIVYMCQNGKWCAGDNGAVHKTGRRFPEIAEVLKRMQEGKDD